MFLCLKRLETSPCTSTVCRDLIFLLFEACLFTSFSTCLKIILKHQIICQWYIIFLGDTQYRVFSAELN